ncbi:hypothetical protein D7006_03250 [Xanthobacter sp. YC-JY1]|nr:hypothetical protein D7006_03250 [Xanthobacter sp. YC-JY1]
MCDASARPRGRARTGRRAPMHSPAGIPFRESPPRQRLRRGNERTRRRFRLWQRSRLANTMPGRAPRRHS